MHSVHKPHFHSHLWPQNKCRDSVCLLFGLFVPQVIKHGNENNKEDVQVCVNSEKTNECYKREAKKYVRSHKGSIKYGFSYL